MKKVPPCPACAATDARSIEYGFPDTEAFEAAERGDIALGGCAITADMPRFECRACGLQY